MIFAYHHPSCSLVHGAAESLELPEDSVDSLVTDPPSGIGFMGKGWDGDMGGRDHWVAWLARQLAPGFRALKPGSHGLVWGLPRTSHWTALALELCGFEIRDRVQHWFLSGFPKSLDVSKEIDKLDAVEERRRRALRFTEWIRSTGLTAARIDEITATRMGGHYTSAASQPSVATRAHLELIRPHVGEVPAWVEEMADQRTVESENFKAREVTGRKQYTGPGGHYAASFGGGTGERVELDETAPSTAAAAAWAGYGTALKPACEDWWLVRKPLRGTVAANLLKHRTGALNVDGCRIDHPDRDDAGWPAHLVIDEDVDTGLTAGRYFYAPKPARSERDAGLDHLPLRTGGQLTGREDGSAALHSPRTGAGRGGGARNYHPTVKGIDLMRYLVRLVTPPGGLVLDPFAGSGTTGVAAIAEGCRFIGCERDIDDATGEPAGYIEIAKGRLRAAVDERFNPVQPSLFAALGVA